MDVNLKDLGATLVTGAYFLLGAAFVACVIFGWNPLYFLRMGKRFSSAAVTMVTLGLAFGSGMLLEDISNKFVDSGTAKIPFVGIRLLPLDEDLRAETFYGRDFLNALPVTKDEAIAAAKKANSLQPEKASPAVKIGRIARRAAEMRLLANHGSEGIEAQQAILSNAPNILRKRACDAASSLYYMAKNTVYTVDNYYDELKQIQTRIDFSRSFALLSLSLALVGVMLSGVALKWSDFGAQIATRFYQPPLQPPPALGTRTVLKRTLSLVLILVTISLLGRFAYVSEEFEFDKRAYGYFLSLSAKTPGVSAPAAEGPSASQARPTAAPGQPAAIGYSGMVLLDKSTFLVIHDVKEDSDAPRLGTLRIQQKSRPLYVPIPVNWGTEPPNDFEAICRVPGKENEVLVAESSYVAGRFGRIFHLALSEGAEQWNVTVLGKLALPKDTENIEGLSCIVKKDGSLLLLLGERGGSDHNLAARVRWAALDLTNHHLQVVGEKALVPPPMSPAQKAVRGCADLYLDRTHRIWSVAAQDGGDDGPFRSTVYQAGTIDPDADDPVQLLPQTTATWTLDAVKVEAVSVSPYDENSLSIATDDENYEGIWRPLFPATR